MGGLDCDFDKRLSISSDCSSKCKRREEKKKVSRVTWTTADGRVDISFIESNRLFALFSSLVPDRLVD